MGWLIFVIISWLTALLIVPLKNWKESWLMGIFGLICIFFIDNTLASLDAFKFLHGGIYLSELPFFYWISYFPGGILFDYFRPSRHIWRIVYIAALAAGYIIPETIMRYFGYFQYINWKIYMAFPLNITGITVTMWFAEWLEEGKKQKK